MRFLNEMGVRYHYIEVDKILKRAVATEMLLFRVHVMYTTWGQWEKKKGKEILLLVINVNQIYKNDHLINEGWCLHVKKRCFAWDVRWPYFTGKMCILDRLTFLAGFR